MELLGEARAIVDVKFRSSSVNDPFDSNDWATTHEFELTLTDDGLWKISSPGWPYWFQDCAAS